MSYIVFNNSETHYENVSVSLRATQNGTGDAIELIFPNDIEFDFNTSGFKMYDDSNNLFRDYSNARTIYYKEYGVNGFMLSTDGSVFTEPTPMVEFVASFGGTLSGNLKQEIENYSELVVPTPTANENYIFSNWSPEIPTSGTPESLNEKYTAIFNYVTPISEYQETKIAELDEMCTNTIEAGTTVNIGGTDYHFTYQKVDDQTNIKELFDATVATGQIVSYHADGEECQDWTTLQFAKIYLTLAGYKSNNVSYYNALKHYVLSLDDAEEIEGVVYGQPLTGEYLETYNHAVQTNTNLMTAILIKYGVNPEDVLGA